MDKKTTPSQGTANISKYNFSVSVPLLQVTVRTPKRVEFQGEVLGITSRNKKGKFDILSYHENFISLIEEELVIHHKGKDPQLIKLKKGLVKVTENNIDILIGIESLEQKK